MVRHRLVRVYLADRTLGSWYLEDHTMVAKTLERAWNNDKRGDSCLHEGVFTVTKEAPIPQFPGDTRKPRPYWHFRLHHTEPRQGILVHRGVIPEHSEGCILPGSRFIAVDTDQPFLEGSGVKLQWMVDHFPDEFELEITEKNGHN